MLSLPSVIIHIVEIPHFELPQTWCRIWNSLLKSSTLTNRYYYFIFFLKGIALPKLVDFPSSWKPTISADADFKFWHSRHFYINVKTIYFSRITNQLCFSIFKLNIIFAIFQMFFYILAPAFLPSPALLSLRNFVGGLSICRRTADIEYISQS